MGNIENCKVTKQEPIGSEIIIDQPSKPNNYIKQKTN
jgi:hypothetical protein